MTATDTTPVGTSTAAIDRFHVEAAALRRTLDELEHIHREAWQKETDAARKAIAGLENDLARAGAEAKAERARNREDLQRAVCDLVDAFRAVRDEFVVQAKLAAMEARDAVARLRGTAVS